MAEPQNQPPANNQNNAEYEPYKLSEIFSLVPEYDGDQISLNTFTQACNQANQMCTADQKLLLLIKIKNQLRGKAAQLINSRNLSTWDNVSQLLAVHFGDSRDLTSLIQDLQRMHQLSNENPLTFAARLQTHNAKMYSAIAKQVLTQEQKDAQTILIDNMCLNTLLTGLEPKLGQIVRAGNPNNMLDAINRIKRELQLSYFENQKFNRTQKPNPVVQKFCSYCKKNGHVLSECKTRQAQNRSQPSSQYAQYRAQPTNQFRPQTAFPQNQFRPQQNFSQNNQNRAQPTQTQNSFRPQFQNGQYRAQPSTSNSNFQRPNTALMRPNYQKTHHLNTNEYDYVPNTDYDANNYDENVGEHYDVSTENDNFCPNAEHYTPYENFSQCTETFSQCSDNLNFSQTNVNFPNPASEISTLIEQIQTMTVQDNFNPNVNFPEQNFL